MLEIHPKTDGDIEHVASFRCDSGPRAGLDFIGTARVCDHPTCMCDWGIDHIVPLAMQGETTIENLRILCFQCNQRAAIKQFGLDFMSDKVQRSGQVIT